MARSRSASGSFRAAARAGQHGVHADSRRQLDGEHPRERGDRALRDEVRAVVAVGALDGPIADVHDRAARRLLGHDAGRRAGSRRTC